MITKNDRLELISVSRQWWYENPNKEEYANAYYSDYMNYSGKTYNELHTGQIVSMYLHEFYLTIKKITNE